MGELLRFPGAPLVERVIAELERHRKAELTRAIVAELVRDRTVVEAFDAVDRGDFDAPAVREVIRGHAGTCDDYVALCERMALVARVRLR